MGEYDFILMDTGTGISFDVTHFCTSAHDILVVISPDPTFLTDAYALIKLLSLNYNQNQFKLLVNLAKSDTDATEAYIQLKTVIHKFLPLISVDYVGYVLFDENMANSAQMQQPLAECYPDSKASKCFTHLANTIKSWKPPEGSSFNLLMHDLLDEQNSEYEDLESDDYSDDTLAEEMGFNFNSYYNDDGTKFDPDLIPTPNLCVVCKHDDDEGFQGIICRITRVDHRGDSTFRCDDYEKRAN
tara:strand:+ start:5667 stop:6395 length:729 start_codon:yes stop_codon:yes gene_type:complete